MKLTKAIRLAKNVLMLRLRMMSKSKDPAAIRRMLRDLRNITQDYIDSGLATTSTNQEMIAGLDEFESMFTPEFWTAKLFQKISAQHPDIPPEAVARAKEIVGKLPEDQQKQVLYIQRLALTDDAFGIIVRGHVLIESALQSCIYAYVPNPTDLYQKLGMFFEQKARLAHMLGIVDKDELDIIREFNKLRNKISHIGSGIEVRPPGFHVTQKEEAELWAKFTTNPATSGEWPRYESDKFPLYLRYMVMHLYLFLSKRSSDLTSRRLTSVVSTIPMTSTEKMAQHYVTILAVAAFASMGTES